MEYVVPGMSGLKHRHQFPRSMDHLSEFFLCLILEGSRVSYKGDCASVYSFDEISAVEFSFE